MQLKFVVFIVLFTLAIQTFTATSQRIDVNVGNNDVVRRERYEHAPIGDARHRHRQRGGPFDGLLPGLIITIGSSALQWYNEGRAVRDARMLSDAKKSVVELDANATFDAQNNGKLVHITGQIFTEKGLTDPEHGLHRQDALQLIKTAEAYQWKEQKSETRTRVNDQQVRVEVQYQYYKDWTKRHADSNRFENPQGHYNNYPNYQLGRTKMTVNDARLSNGLHVRSDLVEQIGSRDHILSLSSESYSQYHSKPISLERGQSLFHNKDAAIVAPQNVLYYPMTQKPIDLLAWEGPSNKLLKASSMNDEIVLITRMPQPMVGDVRVSWEEITAPPDGVSILAMQQGGELVPWVHNADQGHKIYTLFPGKHNAESMIRQLVSKNKTITKFLRIGGWIGSFFGFNLILSCIPALVHLIPFGLGNLLRPLASIASATIALSASIGLSAAVIAVAWLRFRPLVASVLLIVSGAGFFGPWYYAHWKRSEDVELIDSKLLGRPNK